MTCASERLAWAFQTFSARPEFAVTRHSQNRSVREKLSFFSYVRLDNAQRSCTREPCGEATYRRRETGSPQVVAEFFLHISLRRGPAHGLRAIPRHTGLRNT